MADGEVSFPDGFQEISWYELQGDELVLINAERKAQIKNMLAPMVRNLDLDEQTHWGGDYEVGWYDNEGSPGLFKRVKNELTPFLDVPWYLASDIEAPMADDEFLSFYMVEDWANFMIGDTAGSGVDRGRAIVNAGGHICVLRPLSDLSPIGPAWSIATKVKAEAFPEPDWGAGLAIAEDENIDALLTFGPGWDSDAGASALSANLYTQFGTLDTTLAAHNPFSDVNQTIWLRVDYDGSDYIFHYSLTGERWRKAFTVAGMDVGFTPTRVGLSVWGDQGMDTEDVYAYFSWFRDLSAPVFD